MALRIDISFANFTLPGGPVQLGPRLGRAASLAEEAGVETVWVMDHFFQMPALGPAENEMLEGYALLGYLAARTTRVRLGTLVTGVTYRHPGILIKTITSLDVLSGGRFWFGIGAAWYEREHLGLGVRFPPLRERFERLEECLQIAMQMWSTDDGPYQGKHYQLAETLCRPQPLSKPHPAILIGGGGERKTLRLVAQYADACNLFGDPSMVAHKLGALKTHCAEVGRDYGTIRKTSVVFFSGDAAKFVDDMAAQAAVGIDTIVIAGVDLSNDKIFEALNKTIMPAASRLSAA